MTTINIPLYQQINVKFEDPNYEANTRKEMGNPDCLKKPMYIVGKGSKIPAIFRKTGSAALTIIGTLTIFPLLYWSMKSSVELVVLPVSSRILRAVMRSARAHAIMPPKGILHAIMNAIKAVAKIVLLAAVAMAIGYALGLSFWILAGIGIGTFVAASLYKLFKATVIAQTACVIKSQYADHIATAPKHLRMSVMVDGERIDTYIVMQHDKIEAGQKWILATNGNGVPAETVVANLVGSEDSVVEADDNEQNEQVDTQKADPTMLTLLARGLKANVITYNYSGCIASEGKVSVEKAARVYQAMKKMLEDQQGLAAGGILFYGHSLGAGFQAVGLESSGASDFDPNIRYVCVKDRTFSNSSTQLRNMFPGTFGKFLSFVVKRFGWSLNVIKQCEELYDNNIPQVNINHQHDTLMKGNALVTMLTNETNQNGKNDPSRLKQFTTKSFKSKDPNTHMDAPLKVESDAIIQHINTMLV